MKTQSSRYVLTLLCASFMGLGFVPLEAAAQGAAGGAGNFMPTSGWNIGVSDLAAMRGLGNVKLPCIAAASYDNGYELRFSGGGGQMMALAVDFRQEVFKPGQRYTALLSLGNNYAKQAQATALSGGVLIFNLRPLSDFYTTLRHASSMELDIQGNIFTFSLQQLGASLNGLEQCYNTGYGIPVAALSPRHNSAANDAVNGAQDRQGGSSPMPLAPVDMQPLPQSLDDIVRGSDGVVAAAYPAPSPVNRSVYPDAQATVAPPSMLQPRSSSAPQNLTPMPGTAASLDGSSPVSSPRTVLWQARAGEDVRGVLMRWADQAGYDLDWQAARSAPVVQDVALRGSFEEAVSQLLAENGAASGLEGRFEGSAPIRPASAAGNMRGAGAAISSTPVLQSMNAPQPDSGVGGTQDRWNAPVGAQLRTVLDDWAARANVRVVWENPVGLRIREPLNLPGSFESALETLLDQYIGQDERPVARLNIDPQTGRRTLLMNLDNSS